MNKKIFIFTILSIVIFWAGEARAFIAVPFFDITINEHSIGGDASFSFDVVGGTPENFFTDQLSIQTVNSAGSAFTSSISPNNAKFFITQNALSGWQKPSVTCTSSNPLVTIASTDDGDGVVVTGAPFSSVVCDFTNNPESIGASSVLFIPGFEASRLYKTRAIGTEDQLWEPLLLSDVRDLFMNTAGVSKNAKIYTKDIIGRTNLFEPFDFNVYKSFEESLDAFVSEGKISGWLPVPYDWRYDPVYVVNHGRVDSAGRITFENELSAGEVPYIIKKLEELSQNSKTGKVTIVTHSNGGLIAKALIQKLEEMHQKGEGDDIDKIDKLIMVAAPQVGTPDAIAKMLHGYGMRLGGGITLDEETARTFGRNVPAAYNLLPTLKYFETVSSPVVTFDSALDSINNLHTSYGDSITSYSALKNFLLATSDGRRDPTNLIGVSDILSPIILNSALLDNANSIHVSLDSYNIPASISVYKIAGWGKTTISGVAYTTRRDCPFSGIEIGCKDFIDEKMIPTDDGDKTVVTPSAAYGQGLTYYVNLHDYSSDTGAKNVHVDILETLPVINIINNILFGKIELPRYVTTSKPNGSDNLLVSTHSPVMLDVYDTEGKHTGISSIQPNSDFKSVDEDIPNSSYLPFGEGTYISLPASTNYSVAITGTDFGTFTFQAEHYVNNVSIDEDSTSFNDIPVTPTTTATLTLDTAGKPSQISVDVDGDGIVDQKFSPGVGFDPVLYLELLKKTVISLNLESKIERGLIKKIDKIETQIKLGKIKNVKQKIRALLSRMKLHHGHKRHIEPRDKIVLIDMFNQLLDNLN